MNSLLFGPIPSRRFGRSLGVNNIPPKACSYSCVYCQVGKTAFRALERREFYSPQRIRDEAEARIAALRHKGETVDFLTFVPDGEPTLDAHLGELIALLRPLGVRIAVITNASLLWRDDVRHDLAEADCVSLKVDSAAGSAWRKIDRPHPALDLERCLEGMRAFAAGYSGRVLTETMLVAGINDDEASLRATATVIAGIRPAAAYLAIPTRPPAVKSVKAPSERALVRAHQIYCQELDHVELLVAYEGSEFATAGDVAGELLAITAVHPMREEAVRRLVEREQGNWALVEELVGAGKLTRTRYEGHTFYSRKLPPQRHGD